MNNIEHKIMTEKVTVKNASYYEVTAEAVGLDRESRPSKVICRIREDGNLDMRAADELREFALNTLLDRYMIIPRTGLKVSVRYEIPKEEIAYHFD